MENKKNNLEIAIKETLSKHFQQVDVHILDPLNDGVHLKALVISPEFRNQSLVLQHKMVMQPLREHFATSLHALGLKTFTPESWEHQKNQYEAVIHS